MKRNRSIDARFADRWQAGRELGRAILPLLVTTPAETRIVLGLARGGVVVAAEVAAALDSPLDAIVVRKIGSPRQPELAIGAVGPEGALIANRGLITDLGIGEATFDELADATEARRDQLDHDLRGSRPLPDLAGKLAIVVDDGLATGASMRAALIWVERRAAAVIIAIPVAAPLVTTEFEAQGRRIQALVTPTNFGSVGSWYREFDEVTSDEVRSLLGDT